MPNKHIYWFCYFNKSEPSVRYRATYPLSFLEKNNKITYSICYPGYSTSAIVGFLSIYIQALVYRKKGSIIVFQKIRTNWIYSNLLKLLLLLRPENTLYDFDDADYLVFNKKSIDFFIKKSTYCSVGSNALLDYAKIQNHNAYINTSPTIPHMEIKKKKNKRLTLGWVGYYDSHKKNIETLLFPALDVINIPITLILLGVTNHNDYLEIIHRFEHKKNIIIEMPQNINWQNELEIYKLISEFDVGISPLLDTEANRAKSAFKLKQYFSCGVPVLGSPIGANKQFIQDSSNGYTCYTSEDYLKQIINFNDMNECQFAKISANALRATSKFSLEQYCLGIIEPFE